MKKRPRPYTKEDGNCPDGYLYDSQRLLCYIPESCTNGRLYNNALGLCTLNDSYFTSSVQGFKLRDTADALIPTLYDQSGIDGYEYYLMDNNGTAYDDNGDTPVAGLVYDRSKWPNTIPPKGWHVDSYGAEASLLFHEVPGAKYLDFSKIDWYRDPTPVYIADSIPLKKEYAPVAPTECNPDSNCPQKPIVVNNCFPPVDSTTASISALASGVFSGILYQKGSSVQQMVLPGIFSFISENLVRFVTADLPDIIGNSDYATWSAPLLSGTLTALSGSSIGNLKSDMKLFLLGAVTNYVTSAAAIYINPSYCTNPSK